VNNYYLQKVLPLELLTQSIWFGDAVEVEDERYPKMAWQARKSEGMIPKGRLRPTWDEGIQKILKKR